VWFEKWWVIVLFFGFLIGLIYLMLKHQRTKLKKEQAKLERIISERTKEIKEQNNQISDQNNYILTKNQELELTNRELVMAKEKAERLGMAKSQFLSTMSHELRTPMNAVIGMTYILLNENPKPDQVDNLQTLKFSAENLMALINDILDFSKIDAGKITFEDADFDLRDKINSVIQVIKVKADEKGVKVMSNIDPTLPEFLIGDPTRLNQILFNLAGNAVKFTEKGHVTIKVEVKGKSSTECALVFKIIDTGIGIANDKIDSIFDSFTQASLEITRKFGGTGLGLAITKKLIELQGGKISVESQINLGTTFTVNLNYKISDKTNESNQENLPETFAFFHGESVLVVDDNQINLIVAKKFLTKWNLNVETAENGQIAVDLVKKKEYKLVLMDLQMPELDGYQATKLIRAFEIEHSISPIPIIALTASALIEVKNNIKATGMDDFITKPFNPSELNYKISKYLKSVE
jgi:signal transduction histidine kinase/CheY-like chemotaxis protein